MPVAIFGFRYHPQFDSIGRLEGRQDPAPVLHRFGVEFMVFGIENALLKLQMPFEELRRRLTARFESVQCARRGDETVFPNSNFGEVTLLS